MANRERGEVSLTLGGRTYTLRLSLNTLCDLEDAFSSNGTVVGFADIATRLAEMRMRDLRVVLWAALREHHGDDVPTPADAGALFGVAEIPQVLPAIQALFATDPVATESARPPTARRGTGRGGRSTSAPARPG